MQIFLIKYDSEYAFDQCCFSFIFFINVFGAKKKLYVKNFFFLLKKKNMKNVKTDLETISFIADQNADRVRFFLGINQKDADLLIDEIHSEKKVDTKVSKLLRLLVDRLSAYQRYSATSSSESQNSSSLSSTSSLPQNPDLLRMKKKIDATREECTQTKSNIDQQKSQEIDPNLSKKFIDQIEKLKKELEAAKNDKNEVEDALRQQNRKLEEKYIHLKQKYLDSKEEQAKMQNDVDGLKEQLKKFSGVVRKLKTKMTSSSQSVSSQILSSESSELSEVSQSSSAARSQDSLKIHDLDKKNVRMNYKLHRKLNGLQSDSESMDELQRINEKTKAEIERLKSRNLQLVNSIQMEMGKRKKLEEVVADLEAKNKDLRMKIPSIDLEKKLKEKTNKCDALESQLEKTKRDNQNLQANYDTLFQTVSILRTEVASLTDERKKLISQIDENSKIANEIKQNTLEKDVYKLRYNDIANSKTTVEKKLKDVEEENKRLNREVIRLETQITKLKDELFRANQQIKVFNEDALTLSRFGFLLADAVCSSYNPRNVECEIERLIQIVRAEHIALSDSARFPLDPLNPNFPPINYKPVCPECGRPI